MRPSGLQMQLMYAFDAAVLGVLLGVVYDVFRSLRVHFRFRKTAAAILDSLFCLITLAAFLLLMLCWTDGRLRLYLLLGVCAGFFAYRKLISAVILKGLLRLLSMGKRARTGFCSLLRRQKKRVRK